MKIKVTDIDYEINEEDVDLFASTPMSIETIKETLPSELEIEVDDDLVDSEDLNSIIADKITEQTGRLVKTFYEIIGE